MSIPENWKQYIDPFPVWYKEDLLKIHVMKYLLGASQDPKPREYVRPCLALWLTLESELEPGYRNNCESNNATIKRGVTRDT